MTAGAGDELVEIVDEGGRVERLVPRSAMRAGNLRHRSVAVVVVTGAGEVVAHRRADWKDVWPGRWDVCFGGVVAVGETWEAAAVRELAEEAGVAVAPRALRLLGETSYADGDVSAVGRVFAATHDGPFRPADGEVAELVLVPGGELAGWLEGRPLCPDTAAQIVPLLAGLVDPGAS
jgi:8-oxo-dGTP pyrophosphatase MutT (NUDIX family)